MRNGKIYLVKTAHSYSNIHTDIVAETVYAVRNMNSINDAIRYVQGIPELWSQSEHVLDVLEIWEWYFNLGDNLAWFGNACILAADTVNHQKADKERLKEY